MDSEAPAAEEQNNTEEDNIPSDFFDDFAKDEFIQGLSVVDSWDDETKQGDDTQLDEGGRKVYDVKTYIDKYKMVRKKFIEIKHKKKSPEINNYTKPGSRRDPAKTLSAIKQDKEKKVKEILAKCLGSNDDLRPPGTELDEFFEGDRKPGITENKSVKQERKKLSMEGIDTHCSEDRSHRGSPHQSSHNRGSSRGDNTSKAGKQWGKGMPKNYYGNRSSRESINYHHSPPHRFKGRSRSPISHRPRSPFRTHRNAPRYPSPRHSPGHFSTRQPFQRQSPRHRSPRHRSPRHHSPRHHSPRHRSPRHRSPRFRSPRHHSPVQHQSRVTHREKSLPHRSRSPCKRYKRDMSPKTRLSPKRPKWSPVKDSFLYPESTPYTPAPVCNSEPNWVLNESVYNPPLNTYSYPIPPDYSTNFIQNTAFMAPEPVPAPVPPPSESAMQMLHAKTTQNSLEKLVADGIISKADYMKLAPTPDMSVPSSLLDVKDKVELLTRCQDAVSKLAKLHLPNRLIMLNQMRKIDPKPIMPRFCSPLKREPIVKFAYTDFSTTSADQNKMLLKRIMNAVGMYNAVERTKKKKNTCEIGVQTTMPFCQSCEIRESALFSDAETMIDREYFSSSVQTQVVDKDLMNSKSLFASGGGIAEGAPVSICHLTPAQLVSQLAARAKALKSSEDPAQASDYRQRNQQHYQYGNNSPYNNQNYRY